MHSKKHIHKIILRIITIVLLRCFISMQLIMITEVTVLADITSSTLSPQIHIGSEALHYTFDMSQIETSRPPFSHKIPHYSKDPDKKIKAFLKRPTAMSEGLRTLFRYRFLKQHAKPKQVSLYIGNSSSPVPYADYIFGIKKIIVNDLEPFLLGPIARNIKNHIRSEGQIPIIEGDLEILEDAMIKNDIGQSIRFIAENAEYLGRYIDEDSVDHIVCVGLHNVKEEVRENIYKTMFKLLKNNGTLLINTSYEDRPEARTLRTVIKELGISLHGISGANLIPIIGGTETHYRVEKPAAESSNIRHNAYNILRNNAYQSFYDVFDFKEKKVASWLKDKFTILDENGQEKEIIMGEYLKLVLSGQAPVPEEDQVWVSALASLSNKELWFRWEAVRDAGTLSNFKNFPDFLDFLSLPHNFMHYTKYVNLMTLISQDKHSSDKRIQQKYIFLEIVKHWANALKITNKMTEKTFKAIPLHEITFPVAIQTSI